METVNQLNPQTIGHRATTRRTTLRRRSRRRYRLVSLPPRTAFHQSCVNATFPTTATQPTTPSNLAPWLHPQGRFHGVAHAAGIATITSSLMASVRCA